MTNALIDDQLFIAPDLSTHFRVVESRLNPHPVAQICKSIGNTREEKIVDSFQIAHRPQSELVEGLKNMVTRHGFKAAEFG